MQFVQAQFKWCLCLTITTINDIYEMNDTKEKGIQIMNRTVMNLICVCSKGINGWLDCIYKENECSHALT